MLDVLLNLMSVAGAIAVYSGVGAGVHQATARCFTYDKYRQGPEYDNPGPVIAGILWPVAAPVLLPFFGWHLIKKMRLPSFPKVLTAEARVRNYAASPMTVMIQLLNAKMLQHPEDFGCEEWKKVINGKQVVVDFFRGPFNINFLRIDGASVNLTLKEKKLLQEGVRKAFILKEEKAKNDAEAARQHVALNFVETLLLPEPQEHPMGGHK